jgi:hypothetical protein
MIRNFILRRRGDPIAAAALILAFFVTSAATADPNSGPAGNNSVRVPRVATGPGPLDNDVVGNAQLLVPDGTSRYADFGADPQKWYATEIEPGKTYVVEAMDPYSDNGLGSVHTLGVYASDGVSVPPETQSNCSAVDIAPGFGAAAGYNGARCIVRAFVPGATNAADKRVLYIKAEKYVSSAGTAFQIRVRESTIYGRWTTNGYDFHVELQNTTEELLCAEVGLYPNSGTVFNGPSPLTFNVTVPAYGAHKIVIANGTTVGVDKRGALRIQACTFPVNLNTGALHVSTYAFNPLTSQYLYFFPWTANGGANANSF